VKLESSRQPMVKIWWPWLALFLTDSPECRRDKRTDNCDG